MNIITTSTKTRTDLPSASTPTRKIRRTHSDWKALVDTWQASGQTQKSFCETRKLCYRQFIQWKSRLKQKALAETDGCHRFTPVRLTPTPQSTLLTAHAIQVSLPSGLQVGLSPEADTAQASALIQQLMVMPC